MIMRIRNRQSDKNKRGFTLTEIAIVLGIVGLILGAIWVAAAAVYNNLRVSKATTELLTITQNVRALYATSAVVDSGADMALKTAYTAGAYMTANIFPSDMLSATAGEALDPWGGTVAISSLTGPSGVASDSFAVTFDSVPQGACITFLTANTGPGRDPGMYFAGVGTAGSLPTYATNATLPISASTAAKDCGTNQSVGFAFKLHS